MNRDILSKRLAVVEDRVSYAYPDPDGYLTIGVGHMVDRRLGGGLSPAVIDLQLSIDIDEAQTEAQTYGWYASLNDARQNAVCEMMFQLGPRRFSGFIKFLAAMATSDFSAAADQMLNSDVAREQPNRWNPLAAMMRTGEF